MEEELEGGHYRERGQRKRHGRYKRLMEDDGRRLDGSRGYGKSDVSLDSSSRSRA